MDAVEVTGGSDVVMKKRGGEGDLTAVLPIMGLAQGWEGESGRGLILHACTILHPLVTDGWMESISSTDRAGHGVALAQSGHPSTLHLHCDGWC